MAEKDGADVVAFKASEPRSRAAGNASDGHDDTAFGNVASKWAGFEMTLRHHGGDVGSRRKIEERDGAWGKFRPDAGEWHRTGSDRAEKNGKSAVAYLKEIRRRQEAGS